MAPLVDDMVVKGPAPRPTIDKVIQRFAVIRSSLTSWQLRSRVIKEDEFFPVLLRPFTHYFRRIRFFASYPCDSFLRNH
ncbi:hypothetical protein B0H16DRAFT_1312590 [Mycena metata]|uniref:Uncharacterized protein n=1 Tax=Mycena metata TaxID=1033252 RepID=A0AAD7NI48_9AGAR|nr:hypothetical protein B0H16DRAFT_1312590 [Mycena metata]